MMAIIHSDITTDEELGRRVMVRARIIAPCLATIDPESEAGKDAISVLKGVIADLPAAGSKYTRSMSRNGTSITVDVIDAAFDADACASLRSLCGLSGGGALPRGSFPVAPAFDGVWPEGEYS